MGYTLLALNDIIVEKIKPGNFIGKKITVNEINSFIKQVQDEKSEIILRLKYDYINTLTASQITSKIGFHQKMIIRLSDILFDYKANHSITYLYNQIQIILGEILDFLYIYFESDFDLSLKLPKYRHIEATELLSLVLENCLAKMQTLQVDEQMVKVFNTINFHFDIKNKQRLSFRSVEYFSELLNTLEKIEVIDRTLFEEQALELLFNFSFNNADFLTYYTDKINKQLDQIDTRNGRIQFLFAHIKKTRQIIIYNPTQTLSEKTPAAKYAIESWLNEELEYYKNEKSTLSLFRSDIPVAPKIKTSLTVTEFSFFAKQLYESKFLKECSFKDFTDQLCKIFIGPDQEDYLPVSLRTKFAAIRPLGKDRIKTMVISMMNNMNAHS